MRSTSAAQLSLDYSAVESEVDSAQAINPTPTSTEALKVPSFEGYGEVYAAASRRAGRLNAASISESEHKALLFERQLLLDKKFNLLITRQETNRLAYVRWSLDRIEDAKHGAAMDMLEHSISSYEQFSSDLKNLHKELQALQPTPKK
ncbi:MAG: hypothetical protein V4602_12005 [Pseudomonadota bacterium]